MNTNHDTNYINNYVFSKQGGGGISLSNLLNPAILTTSLLVGGGNVSNSSSEGIRPLPLGTELFVPGGLVFIPDNAFQETREYVSTDPFHVPVMDLFEDLLDLVEFRESRETPTTKSITRKKRNTKKNIRVRMH
jgi:hypothetical protein